MKEGWVEDDKQILYAYDANDKDIEEYNSKLFNKLNQKYYNIECEFYLFESSKKLK